MLVFFYCDYRMNSAVQEQNQNTLASPYYLSSGLRVLGVVCLGVVTTAALETLGGVARESTNWACKHVTVLLGVVTPSPASSWTLCLQHHLLDSSLLAGP
jgi:hypothetical protein